MNGNRGICGGMPEVMQGFGVARQKMSVRLRLWQRGLLFSVVALLLTGFVFSQPPPSIRIYHFDVNTGDATLIVSPDGHGVLIDAGDRGRGKNPIKEFLDRMKTDGFLQSLDYTVVTHYDADHIGGMDKSQIR